MALSLLFFDRIEKKYTNNILLIKKKNAMLISNK